MNDKIDYFIRGAILVLSLIFTIVVTIATITSGPEVSISSRILLSIFYWIAELVFILIMRNI